MFKIGSCRLNYLGDTQKFNQLYYTHTSHEAIQILEFILGKENNARFIRAFPKDFEKKISDIRQNIKKCEYLLVEISSIKQLICRNGIHYPAVELGRQYKNHGMKPKLTSKEEIVANLKKIVELAGQLGLKVIFQGHFDTGVKNRQIIDSALRSFADEAPVVIVKDVFKNYKMSATCVVNDKPDHNHFSDFGKHLLFSNLQNLLKTQTK